MDIILYNNSAEKIRVDKTEYLNGILTLSGTLRNACSIIKPSIIIDVKAKVKKVWDDDSNNVIDDSSIYTVYDYMDKFLGCNYVHIPDFNRYYFVDNITSLNQNLWQIDLTVDTLMSFKDKIYNVEALVTRNQYEYDELIADNRYPVKTNCIVEEIKLEASGTSYINFSPEKDLNFNVLVTTFSSNIPIGVPSGTPSISSTVLNKVALSNVPSIYQYNSYVMNKEELQKLQKYIIDNSSYGSGIVSALLLPFNIPVGSVFVQDDISILDKTINTIWGISAVPHDKLRYIPIIKFKLEGKYNNFLDYAPYSQYELYIPYKGWITLDPINCLNKQLLVSYALSTEDGSAMVFITDETSGKLIYGDTCQLGIGIPFNTTNKQELSDQRLTATTNMVLGTIGAGVSIGLGVATGNPLAIAGGAMSLAKNISGFATTMATQHETAKCSIVSGEIGQYAPQDVRLRITYPVKTLENDDLYLATQGKPLMVNKLLKDVHGYTEAINYHLENIDTATSSEIDSIDTLLQTGIIL